jgi:hypothetical protein
VPVPSFLSHVLLRLEAGTENHEIGLEAAAVLEEDLAPFEPRDGWGASAIARTKSSVLVPNCSVSVPSEQWQEVPDNSEQELQALVHDDEWEEVRPVDVALPPVLGMACLETQCAAVLSTRDV